MNTTISIKIQNHVRGTNSRPGTIYYPGQMLKGVVVFNCQKQQRIRAANIGFVGECSTEYEESSGPGTSTHSENILLCDLRQSLFQGPFDVASQTLEWPFEFTIPTTCSYTRVKGNEEGYIPNGDSPLPPSFSWGNQAFGHEADASIRYRLEVEIQSGGLRQNQKSQMPITIRQFANLPPPETSLAEQQFFPVPNWRSRELRTTQHTLKEMMKHAFSNDPELSTPELAFRAYVHFPHAIAVDQNINMGISIKHYTSGPNDPVEPTLILEELNLTLKTFVQIKVARGGLSSNDRAEGKDEVGNLKLKFKPQNLPLDGEIVFFPNKIKLADMLKGSSSGLTADFVTYTINHRHTIRMQTIIRHAETGHQFSIKTEFPVDILSAHEPTVSAVGGVDEQMMLEEDELDYTLPRYEDAVRLPASNTVLVQNQVKA